MVQKTKREWSSPHCVTLGVAVVHATWSSWLVKSSQLEKGSHFNRKREIGASLK